MHEFNQSHMIVQFQLDFLQNIYRSFAFYLGTWGFKVLVDSHDILPEVSHQQLNIGLFFFGLGSILGGFLFFGIFTLSSLFILLL